MSQLKDEGMQKAKDALDRLTGCELSHLSLAEANLIQLIRELAIDPQTLIQELKQRALHG